MLLLTLINSGVSETKFIIELLKLELQYSNPFWNAKASTCVLPILIIKLVSVRDCHILGAIRIVIGLTLS